MKKSPAKKRAFAQLVKQGLGKRTHVYIKLPLLYNDNTLRAQHCPVLLLIRNVSVSRKSDLLLQVKSIWHRTIFFTGTRKPKKSRINQIIPLSLQKATNCSLLPTPNDSLIVLSRFSILLKPEGVIFFSFKHSGISF
ncbi:hypothetical protein SAMN05421788_102311 [Filimonas lacunae]|uniref:Uncharacterized protein n=1 Tax=Filimonas lacunae TaxID=477680 RepID=A0A1N7NB34_9BACT|nr:hypothetical protein SAMN05421788_102311 [Filimonas lacunae]